MIKQTVTFDFKMLKQLDQVRKVACTRAAEIIKEEFDELVRDAPQYSGNYVANLMLGSGQRMGSKGGEKIYPEPKNVGEALARKTGLDAIDHALGQNANFVTNATAHIMKSAGWLHGVTVYNKLDYADTVEAMEERLRPINQEGAHAIEKMMARLASRNEPLIWRVI